MTIGLQWRLPCWRVLAAIAAISACVSAPSLAAPRSAPAKSRPSSSAKVVEPAPPGPVPTDAVSIAAPALAAAAYGKALAVYREGRRNEALGLIDQALVAAPRDVQLRFLKGVVLAELNSTEAAIEIFRALVQDFPELPEPYNNLAVLQAGTGSLDAARETLEGAIRALPSYALAHENLGDIYLRMAIRAWETAEYLKPAEASRLRERLSLARQLSLRIATPAPNEASPKAESPQPDRPRQSARQP